MNFRPLSLAATILILDQASKLLIKKRIGFPGGPEVFGKYLRIRYDVKNPGGAFGLLPDKGAIFAAVAGLAVLLITGAILFMDFRLRLLPYGLGLMLGGAAGNLIDRLAKGAVIDFIQVDGFPVFNLADSAIVIGAGIIIWIVLRGHLPL